VRGFNGDERYLEQGARRLDRGGHGVLIDAFARYIVAEGPQTDVGRQKMPSLREDRVAAMLQRFGSDRRRPADADIPAFVEEFRKLRDRLFIPAGRYDGPGGSAGGGRQPGPSNPLLPGQPTNQTKSSLTRRAGDRKVPPRDYRSPGARESQVFEDIMKAAYL